MAESGDFTLAAEANKRICDIAGEETAKALGKILYTSTYRMKNNSRLADN